MAFFNDAVQLTKSLTESTKLRAWVKEEEKQTQANLLELGRQYYALHRDDPEEPLRDLVNTLADSETRVAQYWELIKEYECLVICEHCGTEMTQGTAFCVECGQPLPVPAPKNVFCARCGTQIVPGSRFCMNCGTPAPEFQPVVHQRFCSGCGTVLEEGARFCMVCGTPAATQQTTVPQPPAAEPVWEENPDEAVPVQEAAYEEPPYEEPAAEPPETAVCPVCGAVPEAGMQFCIQCGTKL